MAILFAIMAFAAINAGQAFATETLAFVPHSGKFPVKGVTVKASEVFFNQEGTTYGCGATTGEGEITSAKAGSVKLRLTNCKEPASGTTFNTPGAKAGEIISEKVAIQLVYASKEKHEAALIVNSGEKLFMSWEIAGFGYKGCGVRGPVLGAVTPVNSAVLTHTLKLKVSVSGLQTPSKYETEAGGKSTALPETNLFCSVWSQGGLGTTGGENVELTTNATEGALEIKA
jgi:hypothetical protein